MANVNLNKVVVTGRLTKATEVLQTKNGRYLVKGSVAVNKTYRKNDYTSFVEFEMFTDKPVEIGKGEKVYIEGRVKSDEWKDKDGNLKSKVKIYAFNIVPVNFSGNDMNNVIVSGRLVKDPTVSNVKEGRDVVKFRIAINRNYKVEGKWKQDTQFVDVSHFGSSEYIEKIASKLSKASFVYITGSLLQERWKDNDGNNRNKISITAETINLSYPNQKPKTSKTEVEDIEKEIEEIDVDEIETPF